MKKLHDTTYLDMVTSSGEAESGCTPSESCTNYDYAKTVLLRHLDGR